MEIVFEDDGTMVLATPKEKEIIVGRSTICGETVITTDSRSFYLQVYGKKRIVIPMEEIAVHAFGIGCYNTNKADPKKAKIVQKPEEIELFDAITWPLAACEGLIEEQPFSEFTESFDYLVWKKRIIEIFAEKGALFRVKKLLLA